MTHEEKKEVILSKFDDVMIHLMVITIRKLSKLGDSKHTDVMSTISARALEVVYTWVVSTAFLSEGKVLTEGSMFSMEEVRKVGREVLQELERRVSEKLSGS